MEIVLGFPFGLLGLVGLPAVILIHLLQERSKRVKTSTWFLLDRELPKEAQSRKLSWIRLSSSLVLQLIAVILLTAALADLRLKTGRPVAGGTIVLDCNFSMAAFRPEAHLALKAVVEQNGTATWKLMSLDPRARLLAQGERGEIEKGFQSWAPTGRTVAPAELLKQLRVGAEEDSLIFITDRAWEVPPSVQLIAVGRPIDNWSVLSVTRVGEEIEVVLSTSSDRSVRRKWSIIEGQKRIIDGDVEIHPDRNTHLMVPVPREIHSFLFSLEQDEFANDDTYPYVVPRPRSLTVSLGREIAGNTFLRRILEVNGITSLEEKRSTVRVDSVENFNNLTQPGIYFSQSSVTPEVNSQEIYSEQHPLSEGLIWDGFFVSRITSLREAPADEIVLRAGNRPVLVVREGNQFIFAFPPSDRVFGNPAFVLLVSRILDLLRAEGEGEAMGTFFIGTKLLLPGESVYQMDFSPTKGSQGISKREIRRQLMLPSEPGFFTVRRDGQPYIRGGVAFGDQGDLHFSKAESFRFMNPDHIVSRIDQKPWRFQPILLVLLLTVVLLAWSRPKFRRVAA